MHWIVIDRVGFAKLSSTQSNGRIAFSCIQFVQLSGIGLEIRLTQSSVNIQFCWIAKLNQTQSIG